MTTNYLTTADVDALISTEVRQALFTAAAEGSTYDSTQFDRAAELASVTARAALENAGYNSGDATTHDLVVVVALGVFVRMAFGRKGEPVPESIEAAIGNLPEGVRIGEVPVPGLTPDAKSGVGGNRWSPTTGTGARPAVMDKLRGIY